MSSKSPDKKVIAAALGALFVLVVGLVAATEGIGKDDPDSDSVAVVEGVDAPGLIEDGQISRESFDRSLQQAAARQGLPEPPPPEDPEYEALREEALNDVLDTAWILGEADERGIEASDREVEQEFEQTKSESFQTEQEYQDFLTESGFTQEDIDLRVKLQLLSTKIQEGITGGAEPQPVSEEDAKLFYEANKEQFVQPASRDIRLIQNPDEAQAQQAFDRLSEDNSPESWTAVAAELSTDTASKDVGGVRTAVTEGVFPDPLGSGIFDAAQGEVVGPIETAEGFYVFQVDTVTEETTPPFEEARAQIDQQLGPQIQQEQFGAFLSDYRDRWTEVTICAEEFITERCDNFDGEVSPCPDPTLPPEQQQQQLEQTGCPPPVLS
ncbi:MAG: peptidyl-prolyl cis-trans isomerase, partial [Actinomycetota bacterium]|nr:peptidyl-prolyl cis-trans isomerase [Actinomycetota bacterium]